MELTTTNYAYKNAAIGSTEKVFQDIHLKSKNIAIQQRDITFLKGELTALISQRVECRTNGTIPEILADLKDYFAQNLPEYSNLLTDVSSILKAFAKTTEATSLRLLLATVDSGMCRKFHTDINDLRLLCTYIGPGTLWLPDEVINYSALQAGKDNDEIVLDQNHIQQVGTGNIALLKGALYPDAHPILHRSPAVKQSGTKRLLLRIDTNEFLNVWG